MKNSCFLVAILLLIACKSESAKDIMSSETKKESSLKYATGFSIDSQGDLTILKVSNPWPKADHTYTYALINREKAAAMTLDRDAYDAIILTPVNEIVVTSTTHIPSLELLGVEETLVGFPGTDYISSKKTRQRIDSNQVRELGNGETLNTEVLLELQPEVVIGYGVDGTDKTLETIKAANIAVIYNGDWVEASALAKAEWLKFFGALYEKEHKADSVFNIIEANYNEAKSMAQKAKERPTVLCGAMHKDVWYLPSGTSPEALFLKDANLNYLWKDTTGKGSLSLSFETVFEKAIDAQLWLSPSYYRTYDDLRQANEHYSNFDAFKNKNIYSFSNTTGETGGVLYYEIGIARPDLVLKDMIKIGHPELLADYETHFFKPLK